MTTQETILLSQTYEIIDEESAEYGEAAERGFNFERVEHDFDEVVGLLKGREPSCSPITNVERTWFTCYGQPDMDGETENDSIHFCDGQPDAAKAIWRAAVEAAGFRVLS